MNKMVFGLDQMKTDVSWEYSFEKTILASFFNEMALSIEKQNLFSKIALFLLAIVS